MKHKYVLLIGLLGICYTAAAQKKDDGGRWKPGVEGAASGVIHGAELSLRAKANYSIHSSSDLLGASQGNIVQDRLWQLKMGIPFYFGRHLEMAGRFLYGHEQFKFRSSEKNNYPLYNSLSDKNLNTIGGSIYLLGKLKKRMFFLVRLKTTLNGDYSRKDIRPVSKNNFIKIEFSPVVGWKVNPRKSWGVGLNYSYSFGNPFLFPIVAYRNSFAPHWGIQAILPARITLRYRLNGNYYFHARLGFKGRGYGLHLNDSLLSDYRTLELRRSEIDFSLTMEHSLKSWLWFSCQVGIQKGIKFDVTNSNHRFTLSGRRTRDRKTVISSSTGMGPFAQVSLFVVPSKVLIDKFRSVFDVF